MNKIWNFILKSKRLKISAALILPSILLLIVTVFEMKSPKSATTGKPVENDTNLPLGERMTHFFEGTFSVSQHETINKFQEKVHELCKEKSCISPEKEKEKERQLSSWEKEYIDHFKKNRFKDLASKKLTPVEEQKVLEEWYKEYAELLSGNKKWFHLDKFLESIAGELEASEQVLERKRDYELAELHESILGRLVNLDDFEKINYEKKMIPNDLVTAEREALYLYRNQLVNETSHRKSMPSKEED